MKDKLYSVWYHRTERSREPLNMTIKASSTEQAMMRVFYHLETVNNKAPRLLYIGPMEGGQNVHD